MQIDEATGKPIVELSHSGLMTFNSCPKKFAFRKIITNFNEERRESDASAVGTAMHEGIQEFMRSRNTIKAVEALVRAHPIELRDPSKANVYSVEASITTLLHVINESELPDYELAYFKNGDVMVPATEIAFLVIVETAFTIFHVRGYIDLVLRSQFEHNFFSVDIKTMTERSLATVEPKYKWDWQTTSYGIPLNALLGAHDRFRTGIFAVSQSDRNPQTKFPNYIRNQQDMKDYEFYLFDSCRRIEYYMRQDHFPRGPGACLPYGSVCPYHDKCGIVNVAGMQMAVNPSGKSGAPPRPFNPIFTARFEV